MKKNILILFVILMAFSSIFAIDIEIGDGTTTSTHVPFYGFYDYSWSTFIINSDLINLEAEFEQIQFNVSNSPSSYNSANQKIYFKHTTDAEVTTAYPDPEANGFTLVYDGDITWDGSGWQGVMLDTPFDYNGTDNLQIVWENQSGQYASGSPAFYTTEVDSNVCAFKYADGTFPNIVGTSANYFPNLRLGYAAENAPTSAALLAPEDGAENIATTTSLEWILGENTTGVDLYFSNTATDVTSMDASALVIENQNTTSYEVSDLETLSTYYWRVVSHNNISGLTATGPVWSFSTEVGGGLLSLSIGDGTTTDNKFPLNFYYKNSLAETIYLAEELNTGGQIEGLTYYKTFSLAVPNTPVNVWIGETLQDDLTDYIPPSELTAVFSGNITFSAGDSGVSIMFDTPYNYGGGNLVILTERPLDTDYYSMQNRFYNTETDLTNRTLSWQEDTDEINPNTVINGTVSNRMPNVTFYFTSDAMGSVTGTVTDGTTGLAGVNLTINETNYQAVSLADGSFTFPFVDVGTDYTLTAIKQGYTEETATFDVVENQETIIDLEMAIINHVEISGQIITNDTNLGIQAHVVLTGYESYEVDTDANGYFAIPGVYINQIYDGLATAEGYLPYSFQVVVENEDLDLGTLVVSEGLYPATNVVASLDGDNAVVTWDIPDPEADLYITEGFEEAFPPADWNIVTTNAADTWARYEATEFASGMITPTEGEYQAGVMWGEAAQNEWLISDSFNCPGGNLTFDFYGHYGSANNDNYYVKVSPDGENWTELWNASDQPEGDNHYSYPVVIDISNYVGQDIQLAWHFIDGDGGGLWYATFIDNIIIGGRRIRANELTAVSKADRTGNIASLPNRNKKDPNEPAYVPIAQVSNTRLFESYNVYRFLIEDEENMDNWTLVEEATTDLTYTDTEWSTLDAGFYKYAVKAVYTNNAEAEAAISNWLQIADMSGVIFNVSSSFGDLIADANISMTAQVANPSGEFDHYETITDATGIAVVTVSVGMYDFEVVADGFSIYNGEVNALSDVMVDVSLEELAFPPTAVVAEQSGSDAVITWSEPTGSGSGQAISEGFEEAFPPTNWTIEQTSLEQTWARYETVVFSTSEIVPTEGQYQAGVMWGNTHQDEWLITGEMTCPLGDLIFDFYGHYGSTHADNYFVKISTDGINWTPLWNATDFPEADNHYDVPVEIDLSDYYGQSIQLAWHFVDGDGGGLWFATYIDNINIGGTRISTNELTAVSKADNSNKNNLFVKNTSMRFSQKDPNAQYDRLIAEQEPYITKASARAENRALEGYKVWRLLTADQTNEENWTLLTDDIVSNLTYTDNSWDTAPSGAYKFAVKSVYSNDNLSPASFSNELLKDMYGTVDGMVTSGTSAIDGATVTLNGNSETTDASGYFLFTEIIAGEYDITASAPGYVSETQTITVVGTQFTSVNFDLTESNILISDSFETYPDFALEAEPWTMIDGDLSPTYAITDTEFLNSSAPMAYIVFNPSMTTPPLSEDYYANTGSKFMASFASMTPPNNDWMITQEFTLANTGSFNFWAKSITDQYGAERFKIMVSDGSTDPNDFTSISGPTYIEAPTSWTQFSYSLADYADQTIRIAIQCLSDDAFMFMVDDVEIDAPGGTNIETTDIIAVSQLKGNYPNPFNPETTIAFSTRENGHVALDIYNIKGQKVRSLLNENRTAGNHNVVWNGRDDNGRKVASGVFFYRMKSGKYSSTKKMILMK